MRNKEMEPNAVCFHYENLFSGTCDGASIACNVCLAAPEGSIQQFSEFRYLSGTIMANQERESIIKHNRKNDKHVETDGKYNLAFTLHVYVINTYKVYIKFCSDFVYDHFHIKAFCL